MTVNYSFSDTLPTRTNIPSTWKQTTKSSTSFGCQTKAYSVAVDKECQSVSVINEQVRVMYSTILFLIYLKYLYNILKHIRRKQQQCQVTMKNNKTGIWCLFHDSYSQ